VKVVSTDFWDRFKESAENEEERDTDEMDQRNKKKAKLSEGFAPPKMLEEALDEFENKYQQ